jgi:hypothetical protein
MGAGALEQWRVAPGASIAWREWGGELVVYVGSHANTHLLTATSGAVLRSLLACDAPLALQAVFDRAFGDPQVARSDMSPAESEALGAMLRDFERLGIVTRLAV